MFELVFCLMLALVFTVLAWFSPKKTGAIFAICALMVLPTFAFAVDGTEVAWMAKISEFITMLPVYISLLVGLLAALLAIALVIPGEQPDKALQAIVDFLSKFSKKPKE